MIRDATHHDVPQLVRLGAMMHAESPRYSRLRYSTEKMARLFAWLIDTPRGLLMVSEKAGEVVGVLAATVTEHWMSDDLVASDFGLYMRADHRGGTDPAFMVRNYRVWADAMGSKDTTLGISTAIDVDRTARLYGRLGFRNAGVILEAFNVHGS